MGRATNAHIGLTMKAASLAKCFVTGAHSCKTMIIFPDTSTLQVVGADRRDGAAAEGASPRSTA